MRQWITVKAHIKFGIKSSGHLPSTQIVLTHDLKGRLVVTIAGNSSQPKPCPAIYYTHDETIKMANYKT